MDDPCSVKAFEGITLLGMKSRIGQDDHVVRKLRDQRLKGVIGDIGGGVIPGHNQAVLIVLTPV
jgi:hypothetical protein